MHDYVNYRNAWRYNGAPDREQELTEAQCKELLKKGGWFVRNTYDFDCLKKTEFWYIIKDKDSFRGFDELSSNERNKLRRAFKVFDYKLVDKKLFRKETFPIAKATFEDYRVTDRSMNETVFNAYLDQCERNNYDYWGAYDKESNELVGFCAVHNFGNSCEYGIIGFWPKYKHNATYPYYGFFYKMNEYYLGEKKFMYVSDGSRSITEHSNIQFFLVHNLKFRKAYCDLRLRYKWWFGVLVRLLYPFRELIPNISVQAVLKMHGMQTK